MGSAPRQSMGHQRQRRVALLHSRQRAEHLAFDAPRRQADVTDDERDPRQDGRLRAENQGGRFDGARRRTRRMGLERLLLQRLRPAVRQPARLGLTTRSREPRRGRLFTVVARPDAAAADDVWPASARCLHRSLLSAGRRVQRRRLDDHATASKPLDPLAVGSRLRRRDLDQRPGSARATAEELGEHLTTLARPSGSRNTTGAPRTTSTARRRRPTSMESSAARGSTWARAGPRRRRAHRPTKR